MYAFLDEPLAYTNENLGHGFVSKADYMFGYPTMNVEPSSDTFLIAVHKFEAENSSVKQFAPQLLAGLGCLRELRKKSGKQIGEFFGILTDYQWAFYKLDATGHVYTSRMMEVMKQLANMVRL